MRTLEDIRSKLESASEIYSVVKTMKAVAASNIHQYEMAIVSLKDYYRTIALGLGAYFKAEKWQKGDRGELLQIQHENQIVIIVFGSDQGLVGRFNDSLSDFVVKSSKEITGGKDIWAVGERIKLILNDEGFNVNTLLAVPNTVNAITSLVGDILVKVQQIIEKRGVKTLYIFHNQAEENGGYGPAMQRLLPLDAEWYQSFSAMQWPTQKIPQVTGSAQPTLEALIREYLFVSLFKACAESLASENESRLNAMQRAEKNINELLNELNQTFHRLRQSAIDEELFDVVAGFEAMKQEAKNNNQE